ncbi:hypothetical protein GALL_340980 [mine drainage metagenome]|uniref:Uncharacterized protein n=1 Tax=mine drainage metagenome TaxID=410659 RepID=A0A1J5QKR9_9ZZZZ
MALYHVPQRARPVVVSGAAFHPKLLGMGDLNVIDVMVAPQRLQQDIGETEHHDVLHGAFAEIMVNAEDLGLVQVLVESGLQGLRAQQVLAERLLDHHAPPPAVLLEQADIAQVVDDAGKLGRAHRHVENDIGRKSRIFFNGHFQTHVGLGIVRGIRMIMVPGQKFLQNHRIQAAGVLGP